MIILATFLLFSVSSFASERPQENTPLFSLWELPKEISCMIAGKLWNKEYFHIRRILHKIFPKIDENVIHEIKELGFEYNQETLGNTQKEAFYARNWDYTPYTEKMYEKQLPPQPMWLTYSDKTYFIHDLSELVRYRVPKNDSLIKEINEGFDVSPDWIKEKNCILDRMLNAFLVSPDKKWLALTAKNLFELHQISDTKCTLAYKVFFTPTRKNEVTHITIDTLKKEICPQGYNKRPNHFTWDRSPIKNMVFSSDSMHIALENNNGSVAILKTNLETHPGDLQEYFYKAGICKDFPETNDLKVL